MKHLILHILMVLAATVAGAAPQFITKGVDLTGTNRVTGALLNQLVDVAVPTNGYAFVIRTNGRPTITAFPGHTNGIWLDTTASPPTLRAYVCCGDADTNWVAATIGGGSVTTSHLASPAVAAGQLFANAVQNTNIANNAVDGNKINAGSINNSHLTSGSVSNVNIADRTITGAKIATLTIEDTNIASATITGGKLVTGTIGTTQLADAGVGTNDLAIGTANQAMMVNQAGTFASWRTVIQWTNQTIAGISLPAGAGSVTNAHTLGFRPHVLLVVMRCVTADLNYAAGDEVEISGVSDNTGSPAVIVSANTANIYLTTGAPSNWRLRDRNGGAFGNITPGNWNLKMYLFTAQ